MYFVLSGFSHYVNKFIGSDWRDQSKNQKGSIFVLIFWYQRNTFTSSLFWNTYDIYCQSYVLKNNDLYSREIKPGVKVGKANGLKLLLDAETFDYTFHKSPSEGFKMAVQHHLGGFQLNKYKPGYKSHDLI